MDAFDTTTHKSEKEVKKRLNAMQKVAELSLSKCAKDISNSGALGTLGMLLELSAVGAKIDVKKIPKPKDEPLLKWLVAYQGCGFILTCKKENSNKLISILEDSGFSASRVGKIIDDRKLIIEDGIKKKEVFNFKKKGVTGIMRGK
ncbi:MAG: AIR synthase-related protein [Thermoplasmata archaeon]